MKCPGCENALSNTATLCTSCGWIKPEPPAAQARDLEPPRANCAYEPCPNRAIAKIRHPRTGAWVNVCHHHHTRPADDAARVTSTEPRTATPAKPKACQERTCMKHAIVGADLCKQHLDQEADEPGSVRRTTKLHTSGNARLDRIMGPWRV